MAVPRLAAAAILVQAAFSKCPLVEDTVAKLTAGDRYDRFMYPSAMTGGHSNVTIQIFLHSIVEVNQRTQHFAIEGYFRVAWLDNRLGFAEDNCTRSSLNLESPLWSSLWQPDIYFDNSLEEEYGAGMMTLSSTGNVYRSQRIHHLFTCKMNFTDLPFDDQTCRLTLASYSKSVDELRIDPIEDKGVEVLEGYHGTTQWKLKGVETSKETLYFGSGENRKGYDFVYLDISLHRRPSSFMRGVFLVAILFALISWSGLFIDRRVAPARVAISVIPVLIMINLSNSVNQSLPPLNYDTWLTSFLFTMQMFCVMAVFEFGLVSYLLHKEKHAAMRFEAFKHIAEAVKKKEELDEDLVPEEISLVGASRRRVGNDKAQIRSEAKGRPVNGSDVSVALSKQPPPDSRFEADEGEAKRRRTFCRLCRRKNPPRHLLLLEDGTAAFTAIFDQFDLDGNGYLSDRELRSSLRCAGKYYSVEQVHEIMSKLGLPPKGKMNRQHFEKYMRDVDRYEPTRTMKSSFLDYPLSHQVDEFTRYAFLVGILATSIAWLATAKAADGELF
eukprot:TRINITY_DN65555_c0_g1_i1.p1 TRINITY_DN65555_c0_g1~~TRINITY_DN65555_c0_g1_i1.p1  ORF type:complete len:566 (+),score=87.91 TRINITY_DN65555_c0_g1_i1:34-1698(+)